MVDIDPVGLVVLDGTELVPQRVGRDEFLARFTVAQADPALREELGALAPDSTDDLGW